MRRITALMLFCGIICATACASDAEKPEPHEATHKESRRITPSRDGRPVRLHTFTLDSEGNILACVVDPKTVSKDGIPSEEESWLQVYSPEGELLRETALPFKATAVNQAPSGMIFVAGTGRVGKINAKGRLLATADSPHLGDREELLRRSEEAAKRQMEQVANMFKTQLERVDTMIEKLNEKEEMSERDEKRLDSLKSQRKTYVGQQKTLANQYETHFSVEAMMVRAMGITSMAVNSKDVFLSCRTGVGYDVWRMDHDFSSPMAVVSGLSGCCGQCDIQADEENLILAENTKFKVSLLDRDGKRLSSFGKRRAESDDGFGSCCNPMNVRCCSNGDILTAESSVGFIKRFNKEGDYLGTVGKAKITGGCKHVAIGFDEKRDRYYMQYEDKDTICVLLPLSEAPEFSEEDLEKMAVWEGLGKLLVGDGKTQSGEWTRTEAHPFVKPDNLTAMEEASDEDRKDLRLVGSFKFYPDGKLEMRGGYFDNNYNTWDPVRQDLKSKTLLFGQVTFNSTHYEYQVTFIDDNTATFTTIYDGETYGTETFARTIVSD